VFFELGKNYLSQKKYKDAYDNFEKVTKIDPKNRWAWVGMYDVCYDTRDYNQAIIIVQKLVEFKPDYREDLVSLYMNTQQFDKALDLINELNETVGKSEKRELYKADILRDAKYQGSEKANLIDKIKKNPKDEANYIALIYMYSQSNQEEKALEIAKQLEKEIPTSDWAQVSLFKFHINNNDGEKAVKSMNTVLASDKIDKKIKHRILNEFLIFLKNNPQYDKDLDKAIGYFDNDKEVKVAKEIAKFYQSKKDWTKAIKYYEMHLKNATDDMETILLLMQAYTENLQFDKLAKISEEQLQLFPTQPQLYYYNGLANNQLKNYKKAKDVLESGIDFIIDDTVLEINFNLQLGEASNGLGDMKKKDLYFSKANQLIEKQKRK
jgi:tetratricopeptide (TPR) repeat protein